MIIITTIQVNLNSWIMDTKMQICLHVCSEAFTQGQLPFPLEEETVLIDNHTAILLACCIPIHIKNPLVGQIFKDKN